MLSEIDLKDWDEQPSKPLYDVPEHTPVKTHIGLLWFNALEGDHAVCYNNEGLAIHMKAWATVNPLKRRFK